jgi:hypothetical protein
LSKKKKKKKNTPGPTFSYWVVAMSGDVSAQYPIYSQWLVQLCALVSCDPADTTAEACLRRPRTMAGAGNGTVLAVASTSDARIYQPPYAIAMGADLSVLNDGDCSTVEHGSGDSAVKCTVGTGGALTIGTLALGKTGNQQF